MARKDDKTVTAAVAVDPSYILTDDPSDLNPDHFEMEGIDASRQPLFNVSEVAKVFFARSPHWIRWRERSGKLILDGKRVGTSRTEGGARVYNLNEIEKIAHALAKQNAITVAQLRIAVEMVRLQARLWEYIP